MSGQEAGPAEFKDEVLAKLRLTAASDDDEDEMEDEGEAA